MTADRDLDEIEIEELKRRIKRMRDGMPSHLLILPQVREAMFIVEGLIKLAERGTDAKAGK